MRIPLGEDEKIFKYYRIDDICRILPNGDVRPTIKFTPYNNTNDPWEGAVKIKGLTQKEDLKPFFIENKEKIIGLAQEHGNYHRQVIEAFYNTIHFVHDDLLDKIQHDYIHFFQEELKNAQARFGIFSASTKPLNIQMWAWYAKGHSGFVVEFDKDHKFFNQHDKLNPNTGIFYKVNYGMNIPEDYLKDFLEQSEKVYFSKHKLWEHENEIRMVMHLNTNGLNENGIVDIPTDCISKIIFGINVHKSTIIQLNKQMKLRDDFNHVTFWQTYKSDAYGELQMKPIDRV